MNNFKFNAEEVVCNGILVGARQVLTEDNYQTIKAFIKAHYMMSPPEIILEELNNSGMIQSDWMVGRRTSSLEDVITRMISGLYSYSQSKLNSRELAEMWMNAQIQMMSAKEIITVLEKALIDCATADYWYTYEKQWD